MKIQSSFKQLYILFFCTVLLAGCGGLPDEDIQKAEQVPTTLKQLKELISKKNKTNQAYLNSEQGKLFRSYAAGENWDQFFKQANQELQLGEAIYQKTIVPIIERDDEKDIVNIRVAMIKMNRHLASARVTASKASVRKDFLISTKQNAPERVKKAQNNLQQINALLATAQQYTEKPSIDYPAKKQDIQIRFEKLNLLRNNSKKSLSLAEIELGKVASKKANYAILGDNAKNISDTLKKLSTDVPNLKSKFDELYRSYSKTLVDMRIDYFVQLGRTSWDNYYDYPTEHTHIYTSRVDQAVATYFDNLGEGKVASTRGRGYLNLYIDKRMWAALKIKPHVNWSSGDDEGEYWINNIVFKYYHKYLITENQKQTETDWQAIKENYYWQNEKNLGLTLLSKPYAMYEEEAIKSAAPPGMEYIAKPIMVNGQPSGSNKYGEWKQDSSGLSFWQYYMAYSFMRSMVGNRPYYYSDWNHYSNRNRSSGYYGSGSRYGTYGSSTYNNSRYSRSTYSRQNPGVKTATGRKKLQTASIRNSGPKSRSRGPSGGGK
ncbi:MAG: hypothetical protein QM504_07010 [Pseudomonadota bacterium]